MDPAQTSRVFDGRADAYARHRMDFSPDAIEFICATAALDQASTIADLGAGTGMLTRHFLGRVGHIFAVEPNDEMRALAQANLAPLDSLHLTKGFSHDTGLPGRSVDAVLAGRSLRWFDPEPSLAEIRRILRPGGWLVALRTPVTDAYSRAAMKYLRSARLSRDKTAHHHHHQEIHDRYFGGVDVVRFACPGAARETWPEFFGRIKSMSFAPAADEPIYAAFESVAREIFDRGAVNGTLTVQFETQVLMRRFGPAA